MNGVTIGDERQVVDEFQSFEAGVRDFDPAIQDGHSNSLASSRNDGGSRLL
jgi:hypothetical protein